MLSLLLAPRLVLVLRGLCVANVILLLPLGATVLEPDLHLKQPKRTSNETDVLRKANTLKSWVFCDATL